MTTVLLVEDDFEFRETAESMLKALGFAVVAAKDGNDAWNIYKEEPFGIDVILTDIIMPNSDGFALIRQLRELESAGGSVVPVIASSGGSNLMNLQICQDLSWALADHFLPKPYSLIELNKAIDSVRALPTRSVEMFRHSEEQPHSEK